MENIPLRDHPMFDTIKNHLVRMFNHKEENRGLNLTYVKLGPNEVHYPNQMENMYQIMVSGLESAVHVSQIMSFIHFFGQYLFNIRINLKAGTTGSFLIFDCSIQPPRRLNVILGARRKIQLPMTQLHQMTLDQIQHLMSATHHPSSAQALATRRIGESHSFVTRPTEELGRPLFASEGSPPYRLGIFPRAPPPPSRSHGMTGFIQKSLNHLKDAYLSLPAPNPSQTGSMMSAVPSNYIAKSLNPWCVLDRMMRSDEDRILDHLDSSPSDVPVFEFPSAVPSSFLIPREVPPSSPLMRQEQEQKQLQELKDTLRIPIALKVWMVNLRTNLELLQGTFTPLGLTYKMFHVPHLKNEYLMQVYHFQIIAIEQLFLLWDIGYFASRLKGGWLDPVDGSISFHIVDDAYSEPFLWVSTGLPSGSIDRLSRPTLHAPLTSKASTESFTVYQKRKRTEPETPAPSESRRTFTRSALPSHSILNSTLPPMATRDMKRVRREEPVPSTYTRDEHLAAFRELPFPTPSLPPKEEPEETGLVTYLSDSSSESGVEQETTEPNGETEERDEDEQGEEPQEEEQAEEGQQEEEVGGEEEEEEEKEEEVKVTKVEERAEPILLPPTPSKPLFQRTAVVELREEYRAVQVEEDTGYEDGEDEC